MRKNKLFFSMLGAVLCVVCTATVFAATGEAPRITKEEAKTFIGSPDAVFLDARTGGSWSSSAEKIKGAVRVDPGSVGSWAGNYNKDTRLIVYCS